MISEQNDLILLLIIKFSLLRRVVYVITCLLNLMGLSLVCSESTIAVTPESLWDVASLTKVSHSQADRL